MIADTKLPEYYRQFTKEARLDIIKYSNTLNKITKERIEYKKEIDKYLENTTVEGMYTLKSIHKLVRRKKVKMPIINLIHDIIEGKKDKEEMLRFLILK